MTRSLGYNSSSHFGVHFGLRRAPLTSGIGIRRAGATRQALAEVLANQVLRVREPEK